MIRFLLPPSDIDQDEWFDGHICGLCDHDSPRLGVEMTRLIRDDHQRAASEPCERGPCRLQPMIGALWRLALALMNIRDAQRRESLPNLRRGPLASEVACWRTLPHHPLPVRTWRTRGPPLSGAACAGQHRDGFLRRHGDLRGFERPRERPARCREWPPPGNSLGAPVETLCAGEETRSSDAGPPHDRRGFRGTC
jgi:hypothetical protein